LLEDGDGFGGVSHGSATRVSRAAHQVVLRGPWTHLSILCMLQNFTII